MKISVSLISPVSFDQQLDVHVQGGGVGHVPLAALGLAVLGFDGRSIAEAQLQTVAGEVIDGRDLVEELPQPFPLEPLIGIELDTDEVGNLDYLGDAGVRLLDLGNTVSLLGKFPGQRHRQKPSWGKRSPGPLSWLAVHEPYDQYETGEEKVGESRPAINQIIYSLYCALVNTYFRWPGRRGGPGLILALLSLDIAGVPSTECTGIMAGTSGRAMSGGRKASRPSPRARCDSSQPRGSSAAGPGGCRTRAPQDSRPRGRPWRRR